MNNYWKHFKTIMLHKKYVFQECCKYGLVWQGIMHDMSKLSPVEFRLAKYYAGTYSPIDNERKAKGYSHSWLHHFHKNPHHWEYWWDVTYNMMTPMPERYVKEMLCDIIAASKVYNGKNYKPEMVVDHIAKSPSRPDAVKQWLLPMARKHLGLEK